MSLFHSKPDENHEQIVNLPTEMMEKILAYVPKKERMKISLVKKQWYAIINSKIENILVRRPTQDNLPQVGNLIKRFPRLKNLEFNVELATEVHRCLDFLPLTLLTLKEVQLSFNIKYFKDPLEGLLRDLRKHGDANPQTYISRIGIDLDDFSFKFHPSQVLAFEIVRWSPLMWQCGDPSSNIWSKFFDALPNIKNFRVDCFIQNIESLVAILKNLIRAFKGLKSLHFNWIASKDEQFDSQKIQDCCNFIKENFPLKSKVIIASCAINAFDAISDVLTNRIVKEEGKNPKIVPRGSPGSVITWTDHEYEKFKRS